MSKNVVTHPGPCHPKPDADVSARTSPDGAPPLFVTVLAAMAKWVEAEAVGHKEDDDDYDRLLDEFGGHWDAIRKHRPKTLDDALAKAAFWCWYKEAAGGIPAFTYSTRDVLREFYGQDIEGDAA